MLKNLFLLFILFLFCGCSSTNRIIISKSSELTPVITGSVVNPSAFKDGGTLVLGAFKPGVGAAADDVTDLLSTLIVKGISDALPSENTPFTISLDDQTSSDFFLEGYIDAYGRDRRFTHMKLRNDQIYLSIDGEIWLRETGEKICLFQSSMVIDLKTQNPKRVAYRMGVAIAHFIGSHNI